MSPRPSTPSTPGQHTCCHRNQKTNPKAAAALSVADRIAACHHRPVRRSTSRCHKPYSCFQYSAVGQVNVSLIPSLTHKHTQNLIQESAAIITVARGYSMVSAWLSSSKSVHVRWIDEHECLCICVGVNSASLPAGPCMSWQDCSQDFRNTNATFTVEMLQIPTLTTWRAFTSSRPLHDYRVGHGMIKILLIHNVTPYPLNLGLITLNDSIWLM